MPSVSGRDHTRRGVFISYARQDGEVTARALQARLAVDAPDVPTWLDRLELEGGVGWWQQIEQQLDRVEFLILVMTPAALHSENTAREWRNARQRGVCVYPVMGVPSAELDLASLPSWMSKAHFYDPAAEWGTLVAHLRRGCQATRVPFMAPPLPAAFVGRARETDALIALLRSGRPLPVTTALRGAGGFGKTTLATAICHDSRVLESFEDGILWVTLGQAPNLLNELIKLHAALTGERPAFVDVEDAARELALRLEHKNCLIVIDDAWSMAHVAPILRAGPACARLITTRLLEVAADAERIDVDEMQSAEATQLLMRRAGVVTDDADPFRRLAARLGEWPLPINLVGATIRQRLARGDSLERALDYASRAIEKRGVTAFDKTDSLERHDAVTRTVGASLDLLSVDEQRRCAGLCIFAENTAIPLSTAAVLWHLDDIDSEELARKLDDLALLEFDLRLGTLRVHDLLRSFFAAGVDTRALHADLLDAWGDPYALPSAYAWRRLLYHLHGAGRHLQGRTLLLDPDWLRAKLEATDVSAIIGDFESFSGDAVLDLVRDTVRLSAPGISQDSQQLPTQLVGRLMERREEEIVEMLEGATRSARRPCLLPILPALDPPGSMLLMTLVGHEADVTAICLDMGHQWLLSASNDGSVRVWDQQQGQLLQTLHHRQLGARAVSSDRDGTIAVSGGADGRLYVWDILRGERVDAFRAERGPGLAALAMSGDGHVAISGSREHVVRVWDVASRTVSGVLEGHHDRVTSVALTADGCVGVSGSEDNTVCVWDLSQKALVRRLVGHTGSVNAVALSEDGRWALSGSSDRTVRLWDVSNGVCLQTMTGHLSSVTAVALATRVGRALSGSSDQTTRLWDIRTGQTLATLGGHSDAVTAVSMDDDGVVAATGSADRTIKLWRLDNLRPAIARTAHAGQVTALVFSSDGRLCASGGGDGQILVREIESGRVIRTIAAHSARVTSLAFTADNACVLSSGNDDMYWLWTVDESADVWMPIRNNSPVDYCALSARARLLVTACADRFVYVWEVPGGALVERYGTRRLFSHLIPPSPRRETAGGDHLDEYFPGEPVYSVDVLGMSPDGSHAIFSARGSDSSGVGRGTPREQVSSRVDSVDVVCLLVLNLETREVQSLSTNETEPVSAFAMDSEVRRLLWAKADHAIEVWALREASRVTTLRGHTGKVNALAFSNDGRHAISCARDRTLRVWDLLTGEQLAVYTADSALRSLAISSQAVIAVGDVAGRVHFLRFEEGRPR